MATIDRLDEVNPVNPFSIGGCTIRPARADDVATLTGLERRVFGADAYSASMLQHLIESRETTRVLVATTDRFQVVACGIAQTASLAGTVPGRLTTLCERCRIDDANTVIGYLKSLVVSEDHRRRGLGTALTQARLDWLGERGTRHVFAFGWPGGNWPALAARLGFTCLGTWPAKTFANGAVATLFHREVHEWRSPS